MVQVLIPNILWALNISRNWGKCVLWRNSNSQQSYGVAGYIIIPVHREGNWVVDSLNTLVICVSPQYLNFCTSVPIQQLPFNMIRIAFYEEHSQCLGELV